MVAVQFLTQSHSASYVMGSGCFFPIDKELVYEADTSLIRMEVKTHTSPASYIFMAWYICIYQTIPTTRVWKQRLLS
jgi:hypothetical protein